MGQRLLELSIKGIVDEGLITYKARSLGYPHSTEKNTSVKFLLGGAHI